MNALSFIPEYVSSFVNVAGQVTGYLFKGGSKFLDLFTSQVNPNTKLTTLNLNFHTKISQEELIGILKENTGLTSIKIACLPVDDDALFFIANAFPGLEELDICRCTRITKNGLDAIGKGCPQLKKLTTSYLHLEDGDYNDMLQCLPNLEYWENDYSSSMGPKTFQQLSQSNQKLQTLIAKFPSLPCDPNALNSFLSGASSLTKLDLSYFLGFNDDNLSNLGQVAKNLEYLCLRGSEVKISAETIANFLKNAPYTLTHFEATDLSSCKFTEEDFENIFQKENPQIKQLYLCGLSKINSASFNLISNFTMLEVLSIQNCAKKLTRPILGELVNGLTNLKELEVNYSEFPADSLLDFKNETLSSLKFYECKWNNAAALRDFDNSALQLTKFKGLLMKFDDSEGLYDFFRSQPNLTRWILKVDGPFPLSDSQMGTLAYDKLTRLKVSGNADSDVTEETMASLVSKNPHLILSEVTVCKAGTILASALRQLKALQTVYVLCDDSFNGGKNEVESYQMLENGFFYYFPEDGKETLKDLISKNHFVRLDISSTDMSSDDLVESLCSNPCSSYLDFTKTKLDNAGLRLILGNYKALAGISIVNCPNITQEVIDEAKGAFGYVKFKYVQ